MKYLTGLSLIKIQGYCGLFLFVKESLINEIFKANMNGIFF